MYLIYENHSSELAHHGIKGQKWGVRRFQDAAGRLTSAGKQRYSKLKSVAEYATRDKGWTNENRRHREYGPGGLVSDNPSRKYKSNSEHLSDASKRLASAARRSYIIAKNDAEALTRDTGWKRQGYGTPFNEYVRKPSRIHPGEEYVVNNTREGGYGQKTNNADYLKYMKGRRTGFQRVYNTDWRQYVDDHSRPNDYRIESAMKTTMRKAKSTAEVGRAAFGYLTLDGGAKDALEYATRDKNWASTKYTRYGYGANPYIKTKK